MMTLDRFGVAALSLDEMVSVDGGQDKPEARSFAYRVGQAAAEVAEFFVGVWDGLSGK